MKAKVIRGSGFRGVLNYVLDEGAKASGTKGAELVGGNMAGMNSPELSAEFSAARRLRPDIERPVWHCSLALPAGERLGARQWAAVAEDFMQRMEFDPDGTTPYTVIRHQDTDHDHVHIIASRIGLDGKIWLGKWEARRAINATQALEKSHGLTITVGLGEARAEQKSLTSREINKAVRTKQEPPRQRLQRLIDEAVQDQPSAAELADRLTLAGVVVRANVASTGRMNGFSFTIDGLSFKGSSLGKGYTWGGLQDKKGVTYDQDRDSESLRRYSATATGGRGAAGDAAGLGQPAGSDSDRGRAGDTQRAGTADRAGQSVAGSVRPGGRDPAPDAGRPDSGDQPGDRGADKGTSGGNVHGGGGRDGREQATQGGSGRSAPSGASTDGAGPGDGDRSGAVGRSGGRGQAEPAGAAGGDDRGGHGRGPAGRDWSSGFRRANAAAGKRKQRGTAVAGGVGAVHEQRKKVDPGDRQQAREVDPTGYLEAAGYEVKKEGRHLSVLNGADEVYRISRTDAGHWVACDHHANGIGDNIALVQHLEPGTGFAGAVYKLRGAPAVRPQPARAEPVRSDPPKMPMEIRPYREAGRAYLAGRGIGPKVIKAAERAGMLAHSKGAVLFVGRDSAGTVRNVTRRAIDPREQVQKRDLRGSDKRHPPILPGSKASVWIVEGGADALALHEMATSAGERPPTVIVSGGANVHSFIDQPEVAALLRGADRVVIASEIEMNADAQRRADQGHAKQADQVRALGVQDVRDWRPPAEVGKDMAAVNSARLVMNTKAAESQRQKRPQSHRSGPSPGR